MKAIKQSVKNTFERVGIDYTAYDNTQKDQEICNRFGGGCVMTTALLAYLVNWVYDISNKYEMGDNHIRLDDFDRVRYFILDQQSDVYMTCID